MDGADFQAEPGLVGTSASGTIGTTGPTGPKDPTGPVGPVGHNPTPTSPTGPTGSATNGRTEITGLNIRCSTDAKETLEALLGPPTATIELGEAELCLRYNLTEPVEDGDKRYK